MIRNVLFDLDGTLTDSADGITRCIAGAADALGVSPPPLEELTHFIGTPLRDIFTTVLDTSDATRIDEAIVLYRERFDSVGYAENRVYDGIWESLAALQESGYALFVATAKRQEDASRVIGHFGLDIHFDEVFGVVTDDERRDKAVLVQRILRDREIDPPTAAMVGDRSTDMNAARHASIRAIGAGWGYGTGDELRSSGANTIAAQPSDVLAQLR
jgi:phosphoglycolate phosphatase